MFSLPLVLLPLLVRETITATVPHYDEVLQDVLSKVNDVIIHAPQQPKDRTLSVMSKMLEVRQTLLEKERNLLREMSEDQTRRTPREIQGLRSIRNQVVEIMDKLTDKMTNTVKPDMFRLKLKIENEILQIKTGDSGGEDREKCGDCDVLLFVLTELQAVPACDPVSPMEDIDIPEVGSQVVLKPRILDCEADRAGTARKQFSDIIDMLDIKITSVYLETLINQKDQTTSLDIFKEIKVEIEDILTKSMIGSLEELGAEIKQIRARVEASLEQCRRDCESTIECDDCAGNLLADYIRQFRNLINRVETDDKEEDDNDNDDDYESKTYIRKELIGLIDENNKQERNILLLKAMNEITGDCEEERLKIYRTLKEPLWMLVNISLQFSGINQLKESMTTMLELLTEKRDSHCEHSCESQERESLQQVLDKLDRLIESAFFKGTSEAGELRSSLTIGLIDILNMLELRVQNIFEDKLRCREEITMIKTLYMPQLNDCISLLLESDRDPVTDVDIPVDGSQVLFRPRNINSIENILECPQKLRVMLDQRSNKLIKTQLENTFSFLSDN